MRPPRTLREALFPGRDTSFGSLIAQLSETERGPHADNFLTNEDSFPRICDELARSAPKEGVYLGVGPDQNFTYLAHCRANLAFILDYRRRNLLLHLLHKALFMLSEDRVSYLSRLTARQPERERLPEDPGGADLVAAFEAEDFDRTLLEASKREVADVLRPLGVIRDDEWADLESIQARLAGPGMNARFLAMPVYPTFGQLIRTPDRSGGPAHLLAREAFYQFVREAQQADRVVPIVGDFAGPTVLPRLAEWLKAKNQAISVIYVSDVEFFLIRAGRFEAYVESLRHLPWAEGALLIRSSTRELDHPERVEGDRGTTIFRPFSSFLEAGAAGAIQTVDDLFSPNPD